MDKPELINVLWRKSTFSSHDGTCVEVAALVGSRIVLRDSTQPSGGVVQVSRAEMAAFLAGVKAREFDGLGN